MEAILTAAEHVSRERDQLVQMVSLTLPFTICTCGTYFARWSGGETAPSNHLEISSEARG